MAAGIVLGLFVGSYLGLVVDRLPAGEPTTTGRSRLRSCAANPALVRARPSRVVERARRSLPNVCSEDRSYFDADRSGHGAPLRLDGMAVRLALGARRSSLVAALVALTVIDLRTRTPAAGDHIRSGRARVPFLVVGALVADEPERLLWAIAGGAGALVFFLVLHRGWRGAMGEGDVRLAALLGVFLGWIGPMHVPVGLFLGFRRSTRRCRRDAGRQEWCGTEDGHPVRPVPGARRGVVIRWGHPLIRFWLGDLRNELCPRSITITPSATS